MSIASEIARLISAKEEIREAIAEKGVSVPETVRLEEMAPLIAAIETESGSGDGAASGGLPIMEWKDILFIDYDGTVLYTYTLDELQTLTELPPLPSHEGLICQGWNYDLDTLKEYDREVTVGAMYTTDDGRTRIYIRLEEGRISPVLGCCPNGTVTVDWGDGSEVETLSGSDLTTLVYTEPHTYPAAGDYTITLTAEGSFGIAGDKDTVMYGSGLLRAAAGENGINRTYMNAIHKVHVGDNASLGNYAFARCNGLTELSLPNTALLTENSISAFRYCYNLHALTVPIGSTVIGTYAVNTTGIQLVSLPNTLERIEGYAFEYSQSLLRITFPNSLTSLPGGYTIRDCHALHKVVYPKQITVIPISSCERIYGSSKVVFLGDITEIGNYAIRNCRALSSIDLRYCTSVPTLGSGALTNLPADCKIFVPVTLEAEWKAATDWFYYVDYIVGV